MKCIGLDAHGATCTIACLSHHDKLIDCHRFETSARNLIDPLYFHLWITWGERLSHIFKIEKNSIPV